MKKLVIVLLVLAGVGGGVYALSEGRPTSGLFTGERSKITRGGLAITITASGQVVPNQRVEIKSKASGTVQHIYFREGQNVRAGQTMIVLDPKDEQRTVDIRQTEVERARLNLERSRITLQQSSEELPMRVESAWARIKDAEAGKLSAESEMARVERLLELEQRTGQRQTKDNEVANARAAVLRAQAGYISAQVELQRAELGRLDVDRLKTDVTLAEQALENATRQLDDANERLLETRLIAPLDCQVLKLNTRVGEVIQGGQATITGGTVLMVVADISEVFIEASVDEADIGEVLEIADQMARPMTFGQFATSRPVRTSDSEPQFIDRAIGQPVRITIDAARDSVFEGRIVQVLPEPRTAGGLTSYTVRILIDRTAPANAGQMDKVQLGAQASVEFTTRQLEDVLLVPFEAVQLGEDGVTRGLYLPVPEDSRKDRFVPIQLGLHDGVNYEIRQTLDGTVLTEGMEVFTRRPTPRLARSN